MQNSTQIAQEGEKNGIHRPPLGIAFIALWFSWDSASFKLLWTSVSRCTQNGRLQKGGWGWGGRTQNLHPNVKYGFHRTGIPPPSLSLSLSLKVSILYEANIQINQPELEWSRKVSLLQGRPAYCPITPVAENCHYPIPKEQSRCYKHNVWCAVPTTQRWILGLDFEVLLSLI